MDPPIVVPIDSQTKSTDSASLVDAIVVPVNAEKLLPHVKKESKEHNPRSKNQSRIMADVREAKAIIRYLDAIQWDECRNNENSDDIPSERNQTDERFVDVDLEYSGLVVQEYDHFQDCSDERKYKKEDKETRHMNNTSKKSASASAKNDKKNGKKRKRRPTAYNFFFKEKFALLSNVKNSSRNKVTTISKMWKNTTEAQRIPYQKLAETEKLNNEETFEV